MKEQSKKVILVIEDELPLLEAIVAKGDRAGFEMISARSIAEGKRFLKDVEHVDAVWIDHFLPGGLGLELVQAMRAHPDWKSIPVFLVTNAIEPDIINKYLKAGIQQYYTKVMSSLDDIFASIHASFEQVKK